MATIEELTAELVQVKEELNTKNNSYNELKTNYDKAIDESKQKDTLIVTLRDRNAYLYSLTGKESKPVEEKTETDKKAEYISNYINNKAKENK